MIFEVDVITTSVKRIRVNAETKEQAQLIAKQMDEDKAISDMAFLPSTKAYKAYGKCSQCGRRVGLFYTTDDNSHGFCIPCYEASVRGTQRKNKFSA